MAAKKASANNKQYWLIKSEPESYGIEHLKNDGSTPWTGVRNFQARNYMRAMRKGDLVLFYHSNCKEPGVYGIAKVASAPYADPTQFDPKSHYFDKRATKEKPIWELVDMAFVKKFKQPVLLPTLRADAKTSSMIILRPGRRLSVTPVEVGEYERVLELGSA
jgi:predicted RNA-binding protein with PUA-like domain